MTKWLAKWKGTQQVYSLPRQESVKVLFSLLEMAKADMDAGVAKDWESYAGGGEGYMIFEGSETQVHEAVVKYSPYISFEVILLISLAQYAESVKKRAAAAR